MRVRTQMCVVQCQKFNVGYGLMKADFCGKYFRIHMSVLDCYQLVETYTRWLKEKVIVKKVGEFCELTTPFVDRRNDYL